MSIRTRVEEGNTAAEEPEEQLESIVDLRIQVNEISGAVGNHAHQRSWLSQEMHSLQSQQIARAHV